MTSEKRAPSAPPGSPPHGDSQARLSPKFPTLEEARQRLRARRERAAEIAGLVLMLAGVGWVFAGDGPYALAGLGLLFGGVVVFCLSALL